MYGHGMNSILWQYILSLDDSLNALQIWKELFLAVANKHTPVKQRRTREAPSPWLSVEVKKLMWERHRLKWKAVCPNDGTLEKLYTASKNYMEINILACNVTCSFKLRLRKFRSS